jgi:hypothetical protein
MTVGNLFRGTLGKAILIAAGVGLLYLASAYVEGIRFQMSGFAGDFGQLVNRNLLAPWQADEDFHIWTGKWCTPGKGPDWPRTRSQCAFVGGAVAGCSIFTYGRSCAVIGMPKVYFDDEHFRESLAPRSVTYVQFSRRAHSAGLPGHTYMTVLAAPMVNLFRYPCTSM